MWDLIVAWWPWLLAGWLTGRLLVWAQPADTLPGLPVLGNVIALGRHGVALISHARQKFGDVFTLNLCGKSMTFLHDPALVHAFFSYPDTQITFRPAVEQFTQRVYGLPSKEFFPKHSAILKDLRHLLVPGELGAHAAKLADCAMPIIKPLFPEGQQVELFSAVKTLVFRSSVEVLFGKDFFGCVPGGAGELQEVFFEFEAAFELAASPVPHWLQPGFARARSQLLLWLGKLSQLPNFASTTAGQLTIRAELRPELAPNLLLALLWASQANTVPATFWSIAFLLLPENHAHLSTVQSELRQELGGSESDHGSAGTSSAQLAKAAFKLAMDRKSTISRCVAETIRLRSHSIDLRIVAQDVELVASTGAKVKLPTGRLLAVCPWESHHDSALYPNAWQFDPDRAPLNLADGSAIVPSVAGLAFGGGSYRCPGRFFAEMEVALLVQLLLWHVRLDLVASSRQAKAQAEEGQEQPQPLQPIGIPAALLQVFGPVALQLFGERAEWGFGLFGGGAGGSTTLQDSSSTSGAHTPSQLETWQASGDTAGLLPKCNLQRLVGLKFPDEPCLVTTEHKGWAQRSA